MVNSTLNKGEGGRYVVTARLIGVNDDAGNVVTLAQNAGETPEAFGKRLADALEPAVKSLADAKACIDQRTAQARQGRRGRGQGPQDAAEPRARRVLPVAPRAGQEGAARGDREAPAGVHQGRSAEPAGLDRARHPVPGRPTTRPTRSWPSSRCSGSRRPTRSCARSCSSTSCSRATRRPRSRWPTKDSSSIRTTPTCTTSRATPASS